MRLKFSSVLGHKITGNSVNSFELSLLPALANLVWYGLELVVAHVEGHQAGQPADRRGEAPMGGK